MKASMQLSRAIFGMGVVLSIGALTAGRFLFVRMVLRTFRDSLINEIIIVDDKEFTSNDPYSIVYEAAFLGLSRDVQNPMMLVRLTSEEPTSELQSLMRSSYAVFCLKKKRI